jgi:hypothetical protein
MDRGSPRRVEATHLTRTHVQGPDGTPPERGLTRPVCHHEGHLSHPWLVPYPTTCDHRTRTVWPRV